MANVKKNHIEKLKDGKYRLLSHDGKNLGTFDSEAEAAKHEGQVEYFKAHKNEGGSDDEYRIDKDYSISVHHDDEHLNARDFPQVYYCRHMEPGLCGYDKEKILVDADAMKNMNPTFSGKPVYVGHQKVDVSKIQEQADGYVVDSFYNELDGWSWAKFIVVSDKGKDAIAQGWAVSNAYVPTEFASGGQSHAIDFERKIVNACYTHLAIVPDPRYEGAKIFTQDEYKAYCTSKKAQLEEMKNSKGAKKMFKKIWNTKREEVTTVDALTDDSVVEMENGQSVSIKEMATVYLNSKVKKNEDDKKDKEEKLNGDTEVSVGGEKMPLSQLMNKYQNAQKENEADEKAKKDKEEKENAVKKNAEDEEKKKKEDKKKEDDEKENSKHFTELQNARKNGSASGVITVDTQFDQLARGKANYGSKE